ncbi:DDB1- and CUL4-associated factor homolog 1-like [Pyrus x bretschneideri]|uniref:DDB1- and CUL4-associated factor homolog 1-like n=1 Tax=Pyrus x bretschneideri TaxID=225117 RepID=UPI0020306B23|nr:DDB1- and CUL4-associated factor homolog 1-like [Pyrus x bretschneideri]
MEAAMDEQQNLGQVQGEEGEAGPPAPPPPPAAPESQSQGGEEEEDEEEEEEVKNEYDELAAKAQKLMDKITAAPDNPNPTVLHALASLLETQESRYMEENGHSSSNGRTSHNIGRLGTLVRDHDDFFELISSKYLSDARYSVAVQAAAGRLLLTCSLTWSYPHVFEDAVLERIKDWVMDETSISSVEYQNWKHDLGGKEVSDFEMLKTYSTGLLAVCLAGGGSVVEDVLTSGLSAKLMRYLRMRVLGETSISQKDVTHLTESKNTLGAICIRGRDEGRGRARQVLEPNHFDGPRITDERCLDDRIVEGDHVRSISRQAFGEEQWVDGGKPPDGLAEDVEINDADGKMKSGDLDENGRDDSSRRRPNRGWTRSRGKGRTNEGPLEDQQLLTSPGSGSRLGHGRSPRDRSSLKNSDVKKIPDSRKLADVVFLERADNDDCFQDCRVGCKDISDLVMKAVRSAEAEARAANAPVEAIKAAGDAAAEVVKSAALEEFRTTNNEEAAVLAASRAASTVIDAANSVEVSRSSSGINAESMTSSCTEPENHVDAEEYFILDAESLAQLREKYCIQCLETLGEYVEVLGPVLHEKGVDVCLALLQRNSRHREPSKIAMLLPDVMKLICALAAHRKFADLFVDRGGMQKLLAVPRVAQTFFGLSSCLFTIGSLQGIMERVCALPSDVVYQVVELALQLLECSQDQARKNAALFFAAAFVFRAVLDAFDAQDGLQKLLGLLNDAASVRSGVNSGALGLPSSGTLRNDRSPAEVLTSSEKQIAYHACVALRQYFRAHLIMLVDSIRPNKNTRSGARNLPSVRAAYKPLDISNEAMDAIFLQLQKDRKLGPAFVRTRWSAVDKFLGSNGHITMLELCQAPPIERYLHDLLQYALGVLHIVTLVPSSRKLIVNSTLSNNRVGIAVILDAASVGGSYADPEIIQPALNVLVNLVCPPPSISYKAPLLAQGQQSVSAQPSSGPCGESAVADRGSAAAPGTQSNSSSAQAPAATATSGLVGDRRISLGVGAGCAGMAAQLEQGYRQARESVRANNGIKVLLHLLQPRIYFPPAALDCLRALACRVLLGLARDDTIAHILTKLQVGKKLSELIRDSGSQTNGTEQGRWQAELSQAAIELIAIVTNSGRASALAATDAAMPTLRRLERAAIAAATPITYHSRELLLLIHEHLQASGLAATAASLLKEAQLMPLPSLAAPSSLVQQATQEAPSGQLQWPSGRTPSGFLTNKSKFTAKDEEISFKFDSAFSYLKKKPLVFSPNLGLLSKNQSQSQSHDSHPASSRKVVSAAKQLSASANASETPSVSLPKPTTDTESHCKTPIVLPMKRKSSELKDPGCLLSSGKRLHTGDHGLRSPVCLTPTTARKSGLLTDTVGFSTPTANLRDQYGRSTPAILPSEFPDDNQYGSGLATPAFQFGLQSDPQPSNSERLTLDSVVVQYLKHQHRQCPAPITTLPPLSLLHPHVCPEPKRSLDAPSNVTARLGTREFRNIYGGVHGSRKDRQFVYSRFRPWRTCRDDSGIPLTCISFLSDSSHIAVGSHGGELKIFDSNSSNVLESCASHQSPVTLVQSRLSGETELVLSSSSQDVRLWEASSVSAGPMHSFEGCKAARFSNFGDIFAALPTEPARKEILLYDIQTGQLESKLSDTSSSSTGRGHVYSQIHFNPSDTMLLWNGVLWDRRVSTPVHRFDQFTDYGGGGFHPAGNEVIINSEVWDLRKFRLLRSVPSLDQTTITFNARGDVIYAILRRNLDDIMSAVHTRRVKHPLFAAFRTVDAINYFDIATIPVDRCVLDFATEPTDSFVGLITMDDQDEMFASARVYEIGRRRPTDDDSDPDDAESDEEDEDSEDDDDVDVDPMLGPDLDGDDSDMDDMSNDDDDDGVSDDDDDDDGDFIMDDFEAGGGMLEIVTDGEEDDDDSQGFESYSSGDEDFVSNGFDV